jgi:hypothetical protein
MGAGQADGFRSPRDGAYILDNAGDQASDRFNALSAILDDPPPRRARDKRRLALPGCWRWWRIHSQMVERATEVGAGERRVFFDRTRQETLAEGAIRH